LKGLEEEYEMNFEKVRASNAIDYMLRTTQQHHVQLSFIADQKTNIIIAFSSVLLIFLLLIIHLIKYGGVLFPWVLFHSLHSL
jgi:hypothetical protein